MKSNNKKRIEKIEKQLNFKSTVRKIAKVLVIDGQQDFDISSLDADVIFMRPYNGRCLLPDGLTYPDAFKNGPIITWSFIKV
jgi:hypothetical protein